jgi:hypothetical protein
MVHELSMATATAHNTALTPFTTLLGTEEQHSCNHALRQLPAVSLLPAAA